MQETSISRQQSEGNAHGKPSLDIAHFKPEMNCERAKGRVTIVCKGTQREPVGPKKMVP
jgi:hypothetical protein